MIRVGQNESPFDSRFLSASLNVTPERFTTVMGASKLPLILVEVSLLRNRRLGFFVVDIEFILFGNLEGRVLSCSNFYYALTIDCYPI